MSSAAGTFQSKYFRPPKPYTNEQLAATWRSREAQLLRVLSARNLDGIKSTFDKLCLGDKGGLTAVEFVAALLNLLGHLMFDKQEFCIQILELFAAIDVNGDKTMEWDELLEYVVQTVTASVTNIDMDIDSFRGAGSIAAVKSAAATSFHTSDRVSLDKYTYQPLPPPLDAAISPEAAAEEDPAANSAGTLMSQLFDDVFDFMENVVDPISDDQYVLAYRRSSTVVELLAWTLQDLEPTLTPVRRYRHGTALYSHFVLAATFIKEARVIASCSRQAEDGGMCANFYDFDTCALKRRVTLDYPALTISYSQAARAICFYAAATGVVYLFDVYSLQHTRSVATGEAAIHAAVALSQYAVDAVIVGTNTGSIQVIDDTTWKPVAGTMVLAHEFGVRSLAYSDRFQMLLSIGQDSDRRYGGAGEDVYAVLLWDVGPWLERCKEVRRSRNAAAAALHLAQVGSPRKGGLRPSGIGAARGTPGKVVGGSGTSSAVDPASSSASSVLGGGGLSAGPSLLSVDEPATGSVAAAAALLTAELSIPSVSAWSSSMPMSSLQIRPRMLKGHTAAPLAIVIQDEPGTPPHAISSDCAGVIIIWHLLTGERLQKLVMSPPPVAFDMPAAGELSEDEAEGDDDARSKGGRSRPSSGSAPKAAGGSGVSGGDPKTSTTRSDVTGGVDGSDGFPRTLGATKASSILTAMSHTQRSHGAGSAPSASGQSQLLASTKSTITVAKMRRSSLLVLEGDLPGEKLIHALEQKGQWFSNNGTGHDVSDTILSAAKNTGFHLKSIPDKATAYIPEYVDPSAMRPSYASTFDSAGSLTEMPSMASHAEAFADEGLDRPSPRAGSSMGVRGALLGLASPRAGPGASRLPMSPLRPTSTAETTIVSTAVKNYMRAANAKLLSGSSSSQPTLKGGARALRRRSITEFAVSLTRTADSANVMSSAAMLQIIRDTLETDELTTEQLVAATESSAAGLDPVHASGDAARKYTAHKGAGLRRNSIAVLEDAMTSAIDEPPSGSMDSISPSVSGTRGAGGFKAPASAKTVAMPKRPEPKGSVRVGEHFDSLTLGPDLRAALHLVLTHILDKPHAREMVSSGQNALTLRSMYAPAVGASRARITDAGFQGGNSGDQGKKHALFANLCDTDNDAILGIGHLTKLPESALAALLVVPIKAGLNGEKKHLLLMGGPAVPRGRSAALARLRVMSGAAVTSPQVLIDGGDAAMGGEGRENAFSVQFAPVGSSLYRHGMAAYVWTQQVPPRDGIIAALFISPLLMFVTLTASTLTLWDSLTGRPVRIIPKQLIVGDAAAHAGVGGDGPELSSLCLDDRQRKVIVGDSHGYIHVINPLTGTVMKQLSPDPLVLGRRFVDKVTDGAAGAASARKPRAGTKPSDDDADDALDDEDAITDVLPSAGTAVSIMRYANSEGEIACFGITGSVWVTDEGSLEGWSAEEPGAALRRRFPVPRAVIWTKIPLIDRPPQTMRRLQLLVGDTLAAQVSAATSMSSSVFMTDGASDDGGTPDAATETPLARKLSRSMSMRSVGAASTRARSASRGGPGSARKAPLALTRGTSGGTPLAAAAADVDDLLGTERVPGETGGFRVVTRPSNAPKVTAMTSSKRLNLLAVSCTMLVSGGQAGGKKKANQEQKGDAGGAGYAILLYDYRKSSFVGALANHETAGISAGMAAAGSMLTTSRRLGKQGGTSPRRGDRKGARDRSPEFSGRRTPGARDDGAPDNIDKAAAAAEKDPARMAAYLLPAVTAMMFLDPLPALLSAHDDGSLRIWAVPPASFPFTCRIYWHIPDAVALLPPALLGTVVRKMTKLKVSKSVTLLRAASHIAEGGGKHTDLRAFGVDDDGVIHDEGAGVDAPAEETSGGTAGINGEQISGVHNRIPTSLCAFAAGLALPMTMGSLAPTGHQKYLTVPPPPPPAPDTLERASSMFKDSSAAIRGETATYLAADTTGSIKLYSGEGPTAADMLTDEGVTKFNEYPCVDRQGMIMWCGDSDGEIHRYYVSPRAFAKAGLHVVEPVPVDVVAPGLMDTVMGPPTELPLKTVLRALEFSHKQTFLREQLIGNRMTAAAAADDQDAASAAMWEGVIQLTNSASALHVVGEILPPVNQGDIRKQLARRLAAEAHAAFSNPMDAGDTKLRASGMSSGAHGGGTTSRRRLRRRSSVIRDYMPDGVCWEGSWRAHGNGDVNITSLSIVHDTGVHALLSSANDGVARLWDNEGRLLGTLDPQPKFQPPPAEVVDPIDGSPAAAPPAPAVAATPAGGAGTGMDTAAAPAIAAGGAGVSAPSSVDAPPGPRITGGMSLRSLPSAPAPVEKPQTVVITIGPGLGSSRSYDRASMTHVCSTRVYDSSKVQLTPAQESSMASQGGVLTLTSGTHTIREEGAVQAALNVLRNRGSSARARSARVKSAKPKPASARAAAAAVAASNPLSSAEEPEEDIAKTILKAEQPKHTVLQMHGVTVIVADVNAPIRLPSRLRGMIHRLAQEASSGGAGTGGAAASAAALGSHSFTAALSGGIVSLVRAVIRQRRYPGLRYGADHLSCAPQPAIVMWHTDWSLRERYVKQVQAATEALALVKLAGLKDTSWWHIRAGAQKLAARRLSRAILRTAQLPELPDSYFHELSSGIKMAHAHRSKSPTKTRKRFGSDPIGSPTVAFADEEPVTSPAAAAAGSGGGGLTGHRRGIRAMSSFTLEDVERRMSSTPTHRASICSTASPLHSPARTATADTFALDHSPLHGADRRPSVSESLPALALPPAAHRASATTGMLSAGGSTARSLLATGTGSPRSATDERANSARLRRASLAVMSPHPAGAADHAHAVTSSLSARLKAARSAHVLMDSPLLLEATLMRGPGGDLSAEYHQAIARRSDPMGLVDDGDDDDDLDALDGDAASPRRDDADETPILASLPAYDTPRFGPTPMPPPPPAGREDQAVHMVAARRMGKGSTRPMVPSPLALPVQTMRFTVPGSGGAGSVGATADQMASLELMLIEQRENRIEGALAAITSAARRGVDDGVDTPLTAASPRPGTSSTGGGVDDGASRRDPIEATLRELEDKIADEGRPASQTTYARAGASVLVERLKSQGSALSGFYGKRALILNEERAKRKGLRRR